MCPALSPFLPDAPTLHQTSPGTPRLAAKRLGLDHINTPQVLQLQGQVEPPPHILVLAAAKPFVERICALEVPWIGISRAKVGRLFPVANELPQRRSLDAEARELPRPRRLLGTSCVHESSRS